MPVGIMKDPGLATMELDVMTFVRVVMARDTEAARQFLKEMTLVPDEAYAKGVVSKAVALCGDAAREWVEGLF